MIFSIILAKAEMGQKSARGQLASLPHEPTSSLVTLSLIQISSSSVSLLGMWLSTLEYFSTSVLQYFSTHSQNFHSV